MSVVGNIKSMTDGVDTLTKKVNALEGAVKNLATSAEGAFKGVNGLLNEGGQRNVGRAGNRPGTGADAASFSNGTPHALGNMMPNSLAGFSQFGGEQGGGGALLFNKASGYAAGAVGIAKGLFGLGTMGMASAMDTSTTVNRALGYYQGTLRSGGGISRAAASSQFMNAMGGGITGLGSDAAAYSTLAGAGFMPGSKDMARAGAEVGGAAKYLGMDNSVAASMIANAGSGNVASKLYQYGISTWNADGEKKSFGQIANDISNVIFDKSKNFTPEGVQEAFRSGFTKQNLTAFGYGDDASQQAMQQLFVDMAAGKKIDLAKITAPGDNTNPADPYLRMNTSQTGIMQAQEGATVQGLKTAAGYVEEFNTAMKDTIVSMAGYQAFLDGVSGTNAGKGTKAGINAGKMLLGGVMTIGGLAIAGATGWTGVGAVAGGGLAAGGLAMMSGGARGGGTPGYGGSFTGKPIGGGTPDGDSSVTAGYGAKSDSGTWAATGGKHVGIDYAVPVGTDVHAHMDGKVSSDTVSSDYGNAVLIDHPDGYQTLYAHLSAKSVSPGTPVIAGQVIGKSGDSGNTTGPHVHYEVRRGKNNPVDPAELDQALGGKLATSMVVVAASTLNRSDDVYDRLRGKAGSSGSSGSSGSGSGSGSGARTILGTGKQQDWAKKFLGKIGAPTSDSNIAALTTWMAHEGGHWHNSAHYNPLNTTLDVNHNESMNSVGVKRYTSWEEGLDATVKTLTGSKADARGYSAIISALKSDSGTQAVLNAITSSAWVTGKTGGDPYKVAGGGRPGYGASIPEPTPATPIGTDMMSPGVSTSGQKNVYITLRIDQASEVNAVAFAERVSKILEDKHDALRMGA